MKQIYGLIGYPLGHSFSKTFFNEKFQAEKNDAEYINFEISRLKSFKEIITRETRLQGMNVTIPYKQEIIKYLDELDETARMIGAVNVIKFIRKSGKLILKGYNSDVIGFTESIRPLLTPLHHNALILGTGGASKAVWYGLESLDVTPAYVSRDSGKGLYTYNELSPEIMNKYKVIVNTTPVGMYPKVNECPDIPYDYITPEHLFYDLIYNPDETLFMKKAKDKGATVKNGLEMLLLQAFAAWNIWNE
ncbi:shikimate dehydrogenase family protein [Coprobacter tertius]|uniref:Shikimate dehydrogenase n=1 Tax=Coprobacter tertius TaxID=2944915 RepID=A0ABT1MIL5_9BACT|nr:shikimate dehydrogenase [Coprobacter tertius]MCP9612224.1 shikimate dehydrogenase [Coprobacter tertius]